MDLMQMKVSVFVHACVYQNTETIQLFFTELDGDSNLIPTAQPAKVGHKKTYLQCEMEQFAGDNSDSNASNLQEVTSEEGDTPDYDELAPLLPLYNTA